LNSRARSTLQVQSLLDFCRPAGLLPEPVDRVLMPGMAHVLEVIHLRPGHPFGGPGHFRVFTIGPAVFPSGTSLLLLFPAALLSGSMRSNLIWSHMRMRSMLASLSSASLDM